MTSYDSPPRYLSFGRGGGGAGSHHARHASTSPSPAEGDSHRKMSRRSPREGSYSPPSPNRQGRGSSRGEREGGGARDRDHFKRGGGEDRGYSSDDERDGGGSYRDGGGDRSSRNPARREDSTAMVSSSSSRHYYYDRRYENGSSSSSSNNKYATSHRYSSDNSLSPPPRRAGGGGADDNTHRGRERGSRRSPAYEPYGEGEERRRRRDSSGSYQGGGGGKDNYRSKGGNSGETEKKRRYSIVARGVDPIATQGDLIKFFGRCGDVKDVYIPLHFRTKQPRGFAFVEFFDEESMRRALKECNNLIFLNNRRLRLEEAAGEPCSAEEMRRRFAMRRQQMSYEMRNGMHRRGNYGGGGRDERYDNDGYYSRRDRGGGGRSRSPDRRRD
ncbi:rna recognition motif-containing protein [Cystoisospora suis]|uniref:Rna recognition motif-containing protein n=1 Tax=Cystoisospora suis TaxID=483139 RepID=A0A2C6KSR8_9APIC|nr:rna recognition motif-containing protein [Cystoisospora suis]